MCAGRLFDLIRCAPLLYRGARTTGIKIEPPDPGSSAGSIRINQDQRPVEPGQPRAHQVGRLGRRRPNPCSPLVFMSRKTTKAERFPLASQPKAPNLKRLRGMRSGKHRVSIGQVCVRKQDSAWFWLSLAPERQRSGGADATSRGSPLSVNVFWQRSGSSPLQPRVGGTLLSSYNGVSAFAALVGGVWRVGPALGTGPALRGDFGREFAEIQGLSKEVADAARKQARLRPPAEKR